MYSIFLTHLQEECLEKLDQRLLLGILDLALTQGSCKEITNALIKILHCFLMFFTFVL